MAPAMLLLSWSNRSGSNSMHGTPSDGWDAIAMEPMSGLADAYNNGKGLRVLAAGERFVGTFGVTQR